MFTGQVSNCHIGGQELLARGQSSLHLQLLQHYGQSLLRTGAAYQVQCKLATIASADGNSIQHGYPIVSSH